MIAPKPYLVECSKCGDTKLVKPKSDALNPMELIKVCSKCNIQMERLSKEVGLFDKIKSVVKD